MTHLAHLIGADLRQFRLVFALWVIVVAACTLADGGRSLAAADPAMREAIAVAGSVLWLTQILMTFVLVSLVMHAHPAVGTDAFWMTRPIAPRLLLAAKLLVLAAVLVLTPAIAYTVLLAAYEVPVRIAAGVIAQAVELHTVIVLLLVIGAALTRNLARFALLCGSTLLALAVAIGAAIAMLMASESQEISMGADSGGDARTSLFVFNVLFVAVALVVIPVQYQTRRRRRSLIAGVIGVAIAYTVSSYWPVPFLSPQPMVPAWAHDEGVLRVAIDAGTISTNTPRMFLPAQAPLKSTVNGRVVIEGLPTGWSAAFAVREAALQLPGGGSIRSERGPRASLVLAHGGGIVPLPVARDLLSVERVAASGPPPREPQPGDYPVLFMARRDELARSAPARGIYRSVVNILLTNHAIDGILALRPGASHGSGGYRLTIDTVSRINGDVTIVARESRAGSSWDRRPWPQYSFYLRNRSRAEAMGIGAYEMSGTFTWARFLPFGFTASQSQESGFVARAVALTALPRYDGSPETFTADEAWLADAELVIVRTTEEGSVTRTLHLPDLEITAR